VGGPQLCHDVTGDQVEMPLILAILVTLVVVVLARSFVINAMALKRDIDRRFDELRVRLEHEANATLEGLLGAKSDDESSH
jgi:hypothetical protein